MLLDLLLGTPIIIFTLLGLRDGIVRKSVALVCLLAGLVLGQLYMHEAGEFLVQNAGVNPSDAPMLGYLAIVLFILLTQSLVYRLAAGGYKIGGIADRIGGGVLGFVEGVLLMSTLLLIFAMSGIPSRATSRDSRFYRPIVNIAPRILDFSSTMGPETMNKLKELTTPEEQRGRGAKRSPSSGRSH